MKLSTVREPNNNKTDDIFKGSFFYINSSASIEKDRIYINEGEIEKIKKWMIKNAVDEVTIEENRILCLEPIRNHEKALFVDLWLNGEFGTKKPTELLKRKQQYVQYFPNDFWEMVKDE